MKQHITPEQLNELSEKGKKELVQYFNLKKIDDFNNKTNEAPESPLLSIGQIIGFLDESKLFKVKFSINHFTNGWGIMDGINHGEKVMYVGDELCDALWSAVKEVLEK